MSQRFGGRTLRVRHGGGADAAFPVQQELKQGEEERWCSVVWLSLGYSRAREHTSL